MPLTNFKLKSLKDKLNEQAAKAQQERQRQEEEKSKSKATKDSKVGNEKKSK